MTPEPLEQAAASTAQAAADVARTGLSLAETVIKKVWTLLEAAVEKQAPSEYLSEKGIRAMQGKLDN